MPDPNSAPFPTEAFERLRRVDIENVDVAAVYPDSLHPMRLYNSDAYTVARWAHAAVPRMRERNQKITEGCFDTKAVAEARANLADLGVL